MARIERAPNVAVGEHWAYRARWSDPLVEVAIVRLGAKSPPRVLVRWVDDAFEGHQDWVAPARLKARWSDVDGFRRHEHLWDEAIALADGYPEAVRSAVDTAFTVLVDDRLATLGGMPRQESRGSTMPRPWPRLSTSPSRTFGSPPHSSTTATSSSQCRPLC